MSVVYNLSGGARARIASAYMTTYFVFGAIGSAAGTQAYRLAGWPGVSAAGAAFVAIALTIWSYDTFTARQSAQSSPPA
jgi:hypothetical protein